MKSKVLSIINFILFLGVVTVNALANILPINNLNTGEISDKYPNLFVPAGFTFSIWSLIYLQLLILTIYNIYIAFKDDKRDLSYFNFILGINFVLNSLWVIFWHYEFVFISWLIMIFIFITLLLMDRFLDRKIIHGLKDKVSFRYTISIYYGWISVATIANTTALLVKLGWDGFGINQEVWTLLVIIVATVIASLTLLIQKNIAYALVFIWAFIGIAYKRLNTQPVYNSIVNLTVTCGILIAILSVITYLRIKPKKIVI